MSSQRVANLGGPGLIHSVIKMQTSLVGTDLISGVDQEVVSVSYVGLTSSVV